jgi:hypothetical protein
MAEDVFGLVDLSCPGAIAAMAATSVCSCGHGGLLSGWAEEDAVSDICFVSWISAIRSIPCLRALGSYLLQRNLHCVVDD